MDFEKQIQEVYESTFDMSQDITSYGKIALYGREEANRWFDFPLFVHGNIYECSIINGNPYQSRCKLFSDRIVYGCGADNAKPLLDYLCANTAFILETIQ